ncbi:MAG: hypothetical protein H6584_02580 [Flavobacteriales bacterium]|nr:hypothetical protein [Flavobacteriales bacterium]
MKAFNKTSAIGGTLSVLFILTTWLIAFHYQIEILYELSFMIHLIPFGIGFGGGSSILIIAYYFVLWLILSVILKGLASLFFRSKSKKKIMIFTFLGFGILFSLISYINYAEAKAVNNIIKEHDSEIYSTANDIRKNTKPEFPQWINTMYLNVEQSEINKQRQLSRDIEKFELVNDKLTFCIYRESEISCNRIFLATQINKIGVDEIMLSEECDGDLSNPNHSWSDYKTMYRTNFIKTEYLEYVPDSLLTEKGELEEGKSIEDYEIVTKRRVYIITIEDSGKIKIVEQNGIEMHKK